MQSKMINQRQKVAIECEELLRKHQLHIKLKQKVVWQVLDKTHSAISRNMCELQFFITEGMKNAN